jgi:hypothetical protein
MTPDPNYPRMMFHPTKDWVIVKSAAEEAALGSEWSRTIVPKGSEPEPVKPPAKPVPKGRK